MLLINERDNQHAAITESQYAKIHHFQIKVKTEKKGAVVKWQNGTMAS